MKTAIKLFMLSVLSIFITSWLLPAAAHPTATGKTCHVVCHQVAPFTDVHPLAIVGGDVIHPPCYTGNGIDNGKAKGFDSAMLPSVYVEMRIYSWYVPQTIGIPLTKSPGSINWQDHLVLRSDHDKL